jgi:hypothetical protein
MHTLHLPPRHLVHVTVVAALTAILAALIIAFAAQRLAPAELPGTRADVPPAVPAVPAPSRDASTPSWVVNPLAPLTIGPRPH